MSDRGPPLRRSDVLLALAGVALGLAGAAAFGAYRAVSLSGEDAGSRVAEFATNLLWPGLLIVGAVALVVWFGWKANLD